MSSTPEDDDVAVAVVQKWAAGGLDTLVPGSLQRGTLSSFNATAEPKVARAVPYAQFEVIQGPVPNSDSTGGRYIDNRKVTIRVWGLYDSVRPALGAIKSLFVRQTLVVSNVNAFMGCLQLSTGLTEDKDRRAGETLWTGTLELHVMCDRSY